MQAEKIKQLEQALHRAQTSQQAACSSCNVSEHEEQAEALAKAQQELSQLRQQLAQQTPCHDRHDSATEAALRAENAQLHNQIVTLTSQQPLANSDSALQAECQHLRAQLAQMSAHHAQGGHAVHHLQHHIASLQAQLEHAHARLGQQGNNAEQHDGGNGEYGESAVDFNGQHWMRLYQTAQQQLEAYQVKQAELEATLQAAQHGAGTGPEQHVGAAAGAQASAAQCSICGPGCQSNGGFSQSTGNLFRVRVPTTTSMQNDHIGSCLPSGLTESARLAAFACLVAQLQRRDTKCI